MKNITLIALLALLGASSLQAECVAIAVGSEQKNAGKFDATFSATKIIDLDFSVVFTPGGAKRFLNGNHEVEFRVFTPRGHLYQSVAIPFTADPSRKNEKVKVEGYPDPMPLRLLNDVTYNKGNHVRVSAPLPVAGTAIMSNSLYGTWMAQAYVDGETVPCSKAVSFTLTP